MQLKCDICGSTDFIKDKGIFICQSCGMKYSFEEVKNMISAVSDAEKAAQEKEATNVELSKPIVENKEPISDNLQDGVEEETADVKETIDIVPSESNVENERSISEKTQEGIAGKSDDEKEAVAVGPTETIVENKEQPVEIVEDSVAKEIVLAKKKCPSCGAELYDDDDEFCIICGARVNSKIENVVIPTGNLNDTDDAQEELKASADVCPACGNPKYDINDEFCIYCGHKFDTITKPIEESKDEREVGEVDAVNVIAVPNVAVCPACGKPLFDADDAFCIYCGTKITKEEDTKLQEPEEEIKCVEIKDANSKEAEEITVESVIVAETVSAVCNESAEKNITNGGEKECLDTSGEMPEVIHEDIPDKLEAIPSEDTVVDDENAVIVEVSEPEKPDEKTDTEISTETERDVEEVNNNAQEETITTDKSETTTDEIEETVEILEADAETKEGSYAPSEVNTDKNYEEVVTDEIIVTPEAELKEENTDQSENTKEIGADTEEILNNAQEETLSADKSDITRYEIEDTAETIETGTETKEISDAPLEINEDKNGEEVVVTDESAATHTAEQEEVCADQNERIEEVDTDVKKSVEPEIIAGVVMTDESEIDISKSTEETPIIDKEEDSIARDSNDSITDEETKVDLEENIEVKGKEESTERNVDLEKETDSNEDIKKSPRNSKKWIWIAVAALIVIAIAVVISIIPKRNAVVAYETTETELVAEIDSESIMETTVEESISEESKQTEKATEKTVLEEPESEGESATTAETISIVQEETEETELKEESESIKEETESVTETTATETVVEETSASQTTSAQAETDEDSGEVLEGWIYNWDLEEYCFYADGVPYVRDTYLKEPDIPGTKTGWYYSDEYGHDCFYKNGHLFHSPYKGGLEYEQGYGRVILDDNIMVIKNSFCQTGETRDTNTYYAGPDGRLIERQWYPINGTEYYFGETGALMRNYTAPDGRQTDENGALIQ